MRTPIYRFLGVVRSLLVPLGVDRSPLLRSLYRRLKRLLKGKTAEIEGFLLHLDSTDSLDLSLDPGYEAFERDLVRGWIREGDVILDIGAHIGLFSLLMARLAGPGGRVYSFEPCPESHALLVRNIETNLMRNIHATQAAVSSREGSIRLFLNPENSGDHRVYAEDAERESVEVDCLALDRFGPLEGLPVDFIKMDIQGAEMDALLGMENVLARSPGLRVLFELWPHGLRAFGTAPLDLPRFFHDRGFRLFYLNERTRRIEEIPAGCEEGWLARLEAGFAPSSEEHVNLLAVGREGETPNNFVRWSG